MEQISLERRNDPHSCENRNPDASENLDSGTGMTLSAFHARITLIRGAT